MHTQYYQNKNNKSLQFLYRHNLDKTRQSKIKIIKTAKKMIEGFHMLIENLLSFFLLFTYRPTNHPQHSFIISDNSFLRRLGIGKFNYFTTTQNIFHFLNNGLINLFLLQIMQ